MTSDQLQAKIDYYQQRLDAETKILDTTQSQLKLLEIQHLNRICQLLELLTYK